MSGEDVDGLSTAPSSAARSRGLRAPISKAEAEDSVDLIRTRPHGGLLTQKVPSVALIVEESNASGPGRRGAARQREARGAELRPARRRREEASTTPRRSSKSAGDNPPDYDPGRRAGVRDRARRGVVFPAGGLTRRRVGVADKARRRRLGGNRCFGCEPRALRVSAERDGRVAARHRRRRSSSAVNAASAADLLKSRRASPRSRRRTPSLAPSPARRRSPRDAVRVAPGVSTRRRHDGRHASRSCAVVDFGAEAAVLLHVVDGRSPFRAGPRLRRALPGGLVSETPDAIVVAPTVASRSVPAAAAAYRALGAATFALSLRSANDAASLQASARVLARLCSGEGRRLRPWRRRSKLLHCYFSELEDAYDCCYCARTGGRPWETPRLSRLS